jgi:hypothetical protein
MINDKENIHVWTDADYRYLVSDETAKHLRSYNTKDDAINALWLQGFKDSARQLHNSEL